MSDSDKPETPATPPEQTPPAAPDAASPEAAPPAAPPPAQPARPERRKPPQGGGGGMPNRRIREPMSLEDDLRFRSAGPRIKDLDAEIEDELEAALGGKSGQELFGAETSGQVQQAATGDQGRKVGTVHSIRNADVFVSVPGGRTQGVLPLEQFPDGPPKPGDTVEVSIEGYDPADGLLILTRRGAAVVANWETVAEGMVVEARVLETNKGGLAVDVNGIRGFMPISQIDLYRVEDAQQFVNQRLQCVVTEVNPAEKNLVVSRRALLEKQREEMREKLWAGLAEGQVRDGIVRSVRDFGAFVDIGGADGLLHVSEMSWKRGQDATKLLQPGQSLKVMITKVDHEGRKIGLSLKRLQGSPWDNIHDKYGVGDVVKGTVSRTMDFGAFVELEPGVEGLIHISELAGRRVHKVSDIVKEGQEVEAKVLSVDAAQQRMSLSLRAAQAPEPGEEAEQPAGEPEPEEPAKPRLKDPTLRGGVGGQTWRLPERPQ